MPWSSAVANAERAIITGADVCLHPTITSMHRWTQNMVTWLASDECCQAGSSQTPAILALPDLRTGSALNPITRFGYLPAWTGVHASGIPGDGSCSGANLQWNDTTILDTAHPIFAGVTDTNDTMNCPSTFCKTLDNANQTFHTSFIASTVNGFETDGFRSVLMGQPTNTPCFEGNVTCGGTQWSGREVVLVKDEAECCELQCDGETYIPIFREDGDVPGAIGTLLAISNRNQVAIDVRVHFFNTAGQPLYQDPPPPAGDGCFGLPLTIPADGNEQIPLVVSRLRLASIFNTAATPQNLGNVVIETLGTQGTHEPVKFCAYGRSYTLTNNAAVENANGFELAAQVETSEVLFEDFIVNVRQGGGTNNLSQQEIVSIQNPQLAAIGCDSDPPSTLTARIQVEFFDVQGASQSVQTFDVPPNGNLLIETATMSGTQVPPTCPANALGFGVVVQGNAVISAIANDDDLVIPVVGASSLWDAGTCGDALPDGSDEKPLAAVDLRTDHRK